MRHLVLPNQLAGTEEVVRFLAQEVSTHTYINIMAQYHPCYKTFAMPLLARPVNKQEFKAAIDLARQHGVDRIDRYGFYSPLRFFYD